MGFGHLERLTAADCRRLLPGAPVGRLVLPTPNFPTVEPVAFAPVDDGVADVLDHELRQGWSVVVKGPLVVLDAELAETVKARLTPWPAAPGDRILLVRSERTTGQRIVS